MRQITERIRPGQQRLCDLPWNRRCLLFSLVKGEYWKGPAHSTTTANVEEAFVYNIRDIRAMLLDAEITQIQIFEDAALNGRKCLLEQVLPKTMIELLKMAPANEIARAHALAQLTVPLPNECQTFEQIREWVEANVDPTTVRPIVTEVPTERRMPTLQVHQVQTQLGQTSVATTTEWVQVQGNPLDIEIPPAPPAILAFRIQVERRETERGTCSYSVHCYGEEMVNVTPEDINEAVGTAIDNGESLRAAVAYLSDAILDSADIGTAPNEDDYDHSDYHLVETIEAESELNRRRMTELLENWLRTHDIEALQELEENATGENQDRDQ